METAPAVHISFYSVRGFTGSALLHKLEDALHGHHLRYTIEEIHNVDEFIKAGLTSVPAIRIGDKIITHPVDDSPDETIHKIMDYILREQANTLLVPVDFSPESERGIAYARMMAEFLGIGITLVHVHQMIYDPVSAGALDVQIVEDSRKRLDQLAEDMIAAQTGQELTYPVMTLVEVGEVASRLIDILEEGKFEMMIMGTKGSDTLFRRFFGSVSETVSRHSAKPVIVVPPGSEMKFPGKIVVGFSEELVLDGELDYLLYFGSLNQVFFDFVHISDDTSGFPDLKNKLFERLVLHREWLCGFNIRSLSGESQRIDDVLFAYAHEVGAHMVVLMTHERSLVERLRHTSVTRKALHHPEVPLMILHQRG